MQQCAGKSKVGYETFYEYKIAQMDGLSNFSGQAADKKFWAQDKLNSEQRMLQIRPQEGVLPAKLAQMKGRAKPNKRPMVNKSVARVIAKKVHKTALKMPKAKTACQTDQAGLGAKVYGANALNLFRTEQ